MTNRLHTIVMHWDGGTNSVSSLARKHYHTITDGDGETHPGDLPPEANLSTADGVYAAHTRKGNTGRIGMAVAAMHGARERPFDPGKYPITEKQLVGFIEAVAEMCDTYGIPVTRKTVLTHAEVQRTLGIRQNAKWDITWLPGMSGPADPIQVGDTLRGMVQDVLDRDYAPIAAPKKAPVAEPVAAHQRDDVAHVSRDCPRTMDLIEEATGDKSKTDTGNLVTQLVSGGGLAGIATNFSDLTQNMDWRVLVALIAAGVIIFAVATYTRQSRRRKADKALLARMEMGR